MDFVTSFKCGDDVNKKTGDFFYCLVSPEFLEAVCIDVKRDLTLPSPETLKQDVSLQDVTLEQFRLAYIFIFSFCYVSKLS
jgi:hypothetical protein